MTTGQSYDIKNLSVKSFNGKTHLGTTTETTFTPIDTLLKDIKGKELLTNIKKTTTVEEFKFTDKVNTFMVCQIPNCKKKMPYAVDCKVITCASCGTCQKVKACEKGMSAHLCAQIDGKDIWLTAFTDVMKMLINKVDLSCNNTTDELKEGLLNLENVKLLRFYVKLNTGCFRIHPSTLFETFVTTKLMFMLDFKGPIDICSSRNLLQ